MFGDKYYAQYIDLVHKGLQPRPNQPKKVIIVGAGMAGLTAAYELLRAGHDPLILEGRARVGGRIYTLREPFSPGLYGEAGGMRLPKSHRLTLAYVEKFDLSTVPFRMGNDQAYCYLNGQRRRMAEAQVDPGKLGYEIAPHESGRSVAQLWEQALEPFRAQLRQDGDAAWEAIHATQDEYSVREYLDKLGWSEGMIELFGLLYNQEAIMNSSFLELLREELGDYYTDMVQIEGGMDRLPQAFLPALNGRIRYGAKVIALDQSPDNVTVHYQTAAGRFQVQGDYAILTIPFSVMRHIEALKPFSRAKQRAIRQLHYDASAKIFFQVRERFWEAEGIYGGGSMTDLPVRNIYYPEHGRQTGRGVLLASYTWGEDAQRWGSLEPHERLAQALENVAQVHPRVLETYETGASVMWHDDEFAGGAFALFDPGQQSLLHQAIIAPEGRYHFAGEHASLGHAWIQGAIESGLRAALEVHTSSSSA